MSEEKGKNSEEESNKTPEPHLPDSIIPEEVKPYLKDMPEPQRKAVEAILLGISVTKHYSGPVPSPEMLKAYEEVLPGCAERLVSVFEQQTKHRMNIENQIVPHEIKQAGRGQNYGFILALAFLIVSGALIALGHEVAGTVLGTVDLVALVSVFVLGKYYQRKERKEEASSEDD